MTPPVRALLLYATSATTSTFSYHQAWPRQFQASPAFDCVPVNVADRRWLARLRALAAISAWRGDLIVILHSVFANALLLDGRLFEAVRKRREPKVYFIGNEYKLMPEKMAFCDALPVGLLVSQSSSPAVHQLYRDRLRCAVIGLPNTGLDPTLFSPTAADHERPIDLGYRADDAPFYLGHRERAEIAEFFTANARRYGLRVDISLNPRDRLDERAWAAFLNRCKGQLGSEAGGDYFDLDDRTRDAVNAYCDANPGATYQDVKARFFPPPYRVVPLRILSGRNVEAAGTKTVQVLLEGRYDGWFEADQHYIPLRHDFSNADEAMRKFADAGFRTEVANRAYALARGELTYDRLIDRFREAVTPLVH